MCGAPDGGLRDQLNPTPERGVKGSVEEARERRENAAAPSSRIPVAGPSITGREIRYVTDAVTNAWYEEAGAYQDRFARAFEGYLGRRHAIELPSCTSAIHLALAALGVGPGDEVIVPDLTWIATAAPIRYVGATPVFADVEPATWCLDPAAVRACLSPRTRAVIAVDLYGNMPDWNALEALGRTHGLAIIEDAAESIGSSYHGRLAGAFGDAGVFSFHGSKTLTTGEGGMLVTDRRDLHDRALFLRDHGREPGDVSFANLEVGFKYRMSDLQAALGLAQLERIDELVDRKRQILSWYREALDGLPLTLNPEPAGTRNSCWMTTAMLDPEVGPALGVDGASLFRELRAVEIDTRVVFPPLSGIGAFRDLPEAAAARERNRIAYDLSPRGLNLPSAASLTRADVARVADELRRLLAPA